jgi:ribonuclease D
MQLYAKHQNPREPFMLINTADQLQEICAAARETGSIALDTEFVWQRTYHPCLGIVQIALPGNRVYLVDTIALPSLDGLGDILSDPDIELILHDALQDLQILSRHSGARPRNIFDTRRAAGFGGLESTISLANLLRSVLNIEITKDETRSDWLQRPLTETQAEYARSDVLHLHELADALKAAADERGNTAALKEEMHRYDEPDQYETATVDTLYSRIRTARMTHETRSAVYALLRWREIEAIARDRPRGHILKDPDLMQIAIHLTARNPMPTALPQRYAGAIHEAIREARALPPEALPPSESVERLPAGVKETIDQRRQQIIRNATAARIDPALVANKAEITALVLHEKGLGPTPPQHLISGWRAPITTPANGTPQQGTLKLL